MTQNRFWTSDTHFFHRNVLKFCRHTRLGDTVEEMNEILIQNWNENVKPMDIVYHLGDFSFGKKEQTEEILKRLNGQIHLIRGNHDNQFDSSLKNYLTWHGDYKEITKKVLGEQVCMMHYPIEAWKNQDYGSIMLHGHLHGGNSQHPISKIKNRMDVGIDTRTDMRLYSWEEIKLQLGNAEPLVQEVLSK